ncbi:hypothetical protein I5B21_003042 [Escherichia coli]|nr:hypothetical protein [Escherichia coli]
MTISFNTIPSNTLVPIFYAEMDNSAANTAQDSGASLLIGHANNGAEIVANSLVLMPSADYARQICGAGSQLARMVEAYRQTDPFGELYVIAVPESTGAAATVTLTVTGAATETGTVNVYVGRTRVQAPVTNGDNVATIASSIQDAINAVPTLPFTASSSAGVVTLTARHKGLPEESTETAARQHIGPLAPVAGSDLYVFRPAAHTVDFHIRVTPDTPEIRAAITAELRSFLLRDGYPQGELKVSRISEAISGANGEYSHQLLAPADNISIAKNELAVLGTISWT